MMKKVAVIQSNYIPWRGYFDIIHDVDQFIFYDDVQYTKNSWRNRNMIKTRQGLRWLTIPIGQRNDRLIYEVELDSTAWAKKHWETLKQSYSKAPYLDKYQEFFEYVYLEAKWDNLSVLNQYITKTISKEFLGINTEFKDSREFSAEGHKLERLIDLLKKVGADLYISGPSAQSYIHEESFRDAGIEIVYKDYSGYPEYPQLFPPFEGAVSIVDVLFNCGPDSSFFTWGWRTAEPPIETKSNTPSNISHSQ
jgi:hypothetical protein